MHGQRRVALRVALRVRVRVGPHQRRRGVLKRHGERGLRLRVLHMRVRV